MRDQPPDAQDHVRWIAAHPREVFGDELTLTQVIAFVGGFDAAWGYTMLRGFEEWLVVRLGSGYEYHWRGLARYVVLDVPVGGPSAPGLSADDERRAATAFLQLVLEFLDDFDDREKRRETYRAFERLRTADELP